MSHRVRPTTSPDGNARSEGDQGYRGPKQVAAFGEATKEGISLNDGRLEASCEAKAKGETSNKKVPKLAKSKVASKLKAKGPSKRAKNKP